MSTAGGAAPAHPTVKQTGLDPEAALELEKPAVVASIDDALTAGRLQVAATVKKAN